MEIEKPKRLHFVYEIAKKRMENGRGFKKNTFIFGFSFFKSTVLEVT